MLTEVSGRTRRFTVVEYEQMGEAGIFDEDDRLELLDGEIIQMNPIGRGHAATVNRLNRLFARLFADRVLLSVQNPIVLDPVSEPQPDLVLLRPREDDYYSSLPTGSDAYLVVEVADTTLVYDSTRKARAYARSNVALLWVVAIGQTPEEDRVVVFEDAVAGSFTSEHVARRGDTLRIRGLSDVPIAVGDFLQ